MFKLNFDLNCICQSCSNFTYFFTASAYLLSVVFYEMIKIEQYQNLFCYNFIIFVI